MPRFTDRDSGPAWSVSGAIAFVHRFDGYAKPVSGKDGLDSIRPDGSRLRRLFGPGSEPDGRSRVAFDAGGQIFTIGADGRVLRRLTAFKQERDISHPVSSPEGRYIAFGRSYDLYVMRANGHGMRRVVDASSLLDLDQPDRPWSEVSGPSWQPLPG